MDTTASFILILLLVLLLVSVHLLLLHGNLRREIQEVRETRMLLEKFVEAVPEQYDSAMLMRLRKAMLAVFGENGLPRGCAFFVTNDGVALTAAHMDRSCFI